MIANLIREVQSHHHINFGELSNILGASKQHMEYLMRKNGKSPSLEKEIKELLSKPCMFPDRSLYKTVWK